MVNLSFHKNLGVDLDVSFQIPAHQFTVLYGPSGAGKTSILQFIAGFLEPDSGSLTVDGQPWFSEQTCLPPQQRDIGYVMQDNCLFPHLTVLDNLQYALPKNADPDIITELVNATGIEAFVDQKPDALSGGQQQRAVLARALVRKPKLLLLDEPFSALDRDAQHLLHAYIKKLKTDGLTIIMVSHSIPEIVKLADHVIQLENGKIVREGTPTTLFTRDTITGEVVSITGDEAVVLVGDQLQSIAADQHQVGDKIKISLHG